MSWLAQGFDNLEKLDRPYGLVYNGLLGRLRQKEPDKQYQVKPLDYLPDDYVELCGLVGYRCECGIDFSHRADFKKHNAEHHPDPDDDEPEEPEIETSATMVENEIERAWNLAIQQLQFGARVAIFLDDTMPIAWDGQVLTVAAKDPDAAEWLNDRIGRTIANELCGILNCLMNVYFVAADGGSDGSANAL